MVSLGDDEDIPDLVEAGLPSAELSKPSGSITKVDSLVKVPITIVTGTDT